MSIYLVSQPNCIKIEGMGLKTNNTTTYDSVRAAARAVQCPNSTIFKKIKIRKS
jgi:hypothetical protein